MRLELSVPRGFRLWSVVLSHGWSALAPFRIQRSDRSLALAATVDRHDVLLRILQRRRGLIVDVQSPASIPSDTRPAIRRLVRDILRMDESLDGLYRLTQSHAHLRWVRRYGAGRMLRAPSVFEDTVKMICTTNCSWSLTTVMIERLTKSLGRPVGDLHTFPTPQAMADQSEKFFRNDIRAGYRSPYLRELAQRVAQGDLRIESVRDGGTTVDEKAGLLSGIKGVGPYALDNLLRLHGVYSRYAHDSWITPQFARQYHEGRKVSQRTIERRYSNFGEWRGLVYWLDMTADWYRRNREFFGEVDHARVKRSMWLEQAGEKTVTDAHPGKAGTV